MTIDDFDINEMQTRVDQRCKEAAEMLAAALRGKIPKDTGKTSRGIRVFRNRKQDEGGYGVVVPFPWGFHEYGYVHAQAHKYFPPRPIVRQTLADMSDQLADHIAKAAT